jgi:hypothetical protein
VGAYYLGVCISATCHLVRRVHQAVTVTSKSTAVTIQFINRAQIHCLQEMSKFLSKMTQIACGGYGPG